jgi:uncharacterized membrane protein YedE/YeeE
MDWICALAGGLIIGIVGLLVGLGIRVANGCTSGHGVCGISELSWRGIVATVFDMLAGVVPLAVTHHLWELV